MFIEAKPGFKPTHNLVLLVGSTNCHTSFGITAATWPSCKV